jgi:hypothetical protein
MFLDCVKEDKSEKRRRGKRERKTYGKVNKAATEEKMSRIITYPFIECDKYFGREQRNSILYLSIQYSTIVPIKPADGSRNEMKKKERKKGLNDTEQRNQWKNRSAQEDNELTIKDFQIFVSDVKI